MDWEFICFLSNPNLVPDKKGNEYHLKPKAKISNNLVGKIAHSQNDVFKTLCTERSYFSLKNGHTSHWYQWLWYVRKKLCDAGSSTTRHKYYFHMRFLNTNITDYTNNQYAICK